MGESRRGSTNYLYEGATTKVTEPSGKWKKYKRDAFGNLVLVTEQRPGSGTYDTSYVYDVLNRLKDVSMTRDGTTQTRTFTFNAQQRLHTVTAPEMGSGASGTITYEYYPDGTLFRKTDPKGQKVEYGCDGLNRLTAINRFPAGAGQVDACQSVALHYDTAYLPPNVAPNPNPNGHVTETVSGSPGCTAGQIWELFDYTKGGMTSFKRMMIVKNTPQGQLAKSLDWSRGLDTQGRVTTEYYPQNHRLDYRYDAMDRLKEMDWADFLNGGWQTVRPMVSGVTYKPSGQLEGLTYLGHAETRAYNDRLQMTRMQVTASGVTKMDMEYRFHATANDGRITQSKDWVSGEEVTYQYDVLNRLVSAATTGPQWGQSYTLDGFSNMSAQTMTKGTGTGTQWSLLVNPAKNRIVNWTYDDNGNVLNDGIRGYTYDVENRLASTTSGGSYAYDPQNQRVFDGTSYTFWSPDGRRIYKFQLAPVFTTFWALEFTGSREVQIYCAGKPVGIAGWNGSGQVIFDVVVTDHLGSVRVRGGQSMRYFPYGQEITTTANGQDKFGTYLRDSTTGLDYANQRYYASVFGRFMTVDQSGLNETLTDPMSWNRYAYVQGDPVNANDPNGQFFSALFNWLFQWGRRELQVGSYAFPTLLGSTFFLPSSGAPNVFVRPFLRDLPFIEGWRNVNRNGSQVEVLVDSEVYSSLTGSGFTAGTIARQINTSCPPNYFPCAGARIVIGVTVGITQSYDWYVKWNSRTPARGEPNSVATFPSPRGEEAGRTVRVYGPDGRAVKDIDYGDQAHSGQNPEVHDWD